MKWSSIGPVAGALLASQGLAQQFAELGKLHLPPVENASGAMVAADVDGDQDQDLLVYDSGRVRLWTNDGTGIFVAAPDATRWGGTCLAVGDVDRDGDLDIVCANRPQYAQNRLYLNDGAGTFTDVTATHMPAFEDSTNWIALADFDDDGDLDLYCANGSSYSMPQQNRLCLNDGSGRFVEATSRLPARTAATLALAVGDLDGDGDVDAFCDDDRPGPDRLWLSLLRQIDAPYLLRLGRDWALDVFAQPGFATTPWFALPLLAPATARIPVPPFGTFGLDPALLVVLPAASIQVPGGSVRTRIALPDDPSLPGVSIYSQALVFASPETARLTNVTADVVWR